MKSKPRFILDEQSIMKGYKSAPKRFNFTLRNADRAAIDAIAKELGIDAITFCRAAVQKVIAEYQTDKEPFVKEVARVKHRIAERFGLAARDADRLAQRIARDNELVDVVPASMDDVEAVEYTIETKEGK